MMRDERPAGDVSPVSSVPPLASGSPASSMSARINIPSLNDPEPVRRDRPAQLQMSGAETFTGPASQPAAQAGISDASPAAGVIASGGAPAAEGSNLEFINRNWDALAAGLRPSNRAAFRDIVLKEEQQRIVIVFRNLMNYRIASMNREENGLKKLRELCMERHGRDILFGARPAKPGEFDNDDRITREELARINFPVEIED